MLTDTVVKSVDDPVLDTKNLLAAKASLQPAGGLIGFEGRLQISAGVDLGNCGLAGVRKGACLVGTAPTAKVGWNMRYDPINDPAAVSHPGGARGTWALDQPVDIPPLAIGEFFHIWSDDLLTNRPPHQVAQKPLELHQVTEIRAGKILFNDFLWHDYLTNVKIARVPMARNVTIADFDVAYTGTGENPRFLDLRCLDSPRVENVTVLPGGPGPLTVTSCWYPKLTNFNCQSKHNQALSFGYHVVLGACTGFVWEDSYAYGARHVFTTTGMSSLAGVRWGSPRNWEVRHIKGRMNGAHNRTMVLIDMHAEGEGGRIINCEAVLASDQLNRAFNVRCPGTQILGCTVRGSGLTKGILINADNCLVQGGSIEGGWLGIEVASMPGCVPADCRILGVDFKDLVGPAIIGHNAKDLTIHGGTMLRVGQRGSSSAPNTAIWLKSVRNCTVSSVTLPKQTNASSIDCEDSSAGQVEAAGNMLTGYGAGLMGCASGLANDDLQARCGRRNWVD